MSHYGSSYYCDNCGDFIGTGNENTETTTSDPPENAVVYRKGGFAGFLVKQYVFCGENCKKEWRDHND